MSDNISLITGGTGAGKTAYALELADKYSSKTYIATAEVIDAEMRSKVEAHIAERDETYSTIEEPLDLASVINKASSSDVVIIDCVTFWINNLIFYKKSFDEYTDALLDALNSTSVPVILVTNEVGLGIIPWQEETRIYAKELAKTNKRLADIASNVYMTISGIPIKIK